MITAICNVCGRVWSEPVILGGPARCPECGSKDVSVAVKQGRKRKSRQD